MFYHVEFSHSVMFNALRPHGLQKGRPPCLYKLLEFNLTHPIESVMPSNHLILCRPLLLLPLIFPSIRVFSNESFLHIRWSKYWSFSFSISPSNEYSGLISLGWTGCISLQSKELSRVFSNSTVQKLNSSVLSFVHSSTLASIHDHRKNHSLDKTDLCWQSNVSAFVNLTGPQILIF